MPEREKERKKDRQRDILQHKDRPKSVISEGRGSNDCRWTGNEDVVGVTSTGEREKQTQLKAQKRGMERERGGENRLTAELLSLERPPSLLLCGGFKYPPASRGV